MSVRLFSLWLCASMACLLPALPAVGNSVESATIDTPNTASTEAILACVQANFPTSSSAQTIKFIATDRANSVRTLHAKSWWQRSSATKARVNMRLLGPPDLAGASYLIAQNNDNTALFTFIPALNKVQRISGQSAAQQLWGTDFSYEDMRFVQGSAFEGNFVREADSVLFERPVYVLKQTPGDTSVYQHIISWIDQETCVSLQVEFFPEFAQAESPQKRLTAKLDSIRQIAGAERQHWLATHLTMHDLQEQTQTVLEIEAVEYAPKLSSSLFNPRSFNRAKP